VLTTRIYTVGCLPCLFSFRTKITFVRAITGWSSTHNVATWPVGLNEDLGRTRLRGVRHGFSSCQAEVEERVGIVNALPYTKVCRLGAFAPSDAFNKILRACSQTVQCIMRGQCVFWLKIIEHISEKFCTENLYKKKRGSKILF
jgi:hypothetical protein